MFLAFKKKKTNVQFKTAAEGVVVVSVGTKDGGGARLDGIVRCVGKREALCGRRVVSVVVDDVGRHIVGEEMTSTTASF